MDAKLVAEVKALKDDHQLPINLKWSAIREKLMAAGLLWTSQEKPESFLTHPSNRGGLMLSWHDCHKKGGAILALGADKGKLQKGVAFQMSPDPEVKSKQVSANQQLVQQAHGLLAPVTGSERYLTCATSHVTAFMKAVVAGCRTEEPALKALSNGILSLDACCAVPSSNSATTVKENPFRSMCLEGWAWEIISHVVEEKMPDLPTFVQQCLNTEHTVAQAQTECEFLQTVAHLYKHAGSKANLKACLDQASQSHPLCLPYLETVGHYIQKFGGGEDFDCINVLQHIST